MVKELLAEGIELRAGQGRSAAGKSPTPLKSRVAYAVGMVLDVPTRAMVLFALSGTLIEQPDILEIGAEPAPDFVARVGKTTGHLLEKRGLQRKSIIVLDGAVFRPASNNAGELGHVVVELDGSECWCGASGCLETVGTPRGIVRQVHASPGLAAVFGVGDALDDAAIAAVWGNVIAGLGKGTSQADALISRPVDRVCSEFSGLANVLDLECTQLAGTGFAAEGKRYANQPRTLIKKSPVHARVVHTFNAELGGADQMSPQGERRPAFFMAASHITIKASETSFDAQDTFLNGHTRSAPF